MMPHHLDILVYDGIKKNAKCRYLTPDELYGLIRTVAKIKNPSCRIVLREFEDYGFLKRLSHQRYIILESDYVKKLKKKKEFIFW
jgi:hypothetical protein